MDKANLYDDMKAGDYPKLMRCWFNLTMATFWVELCTSYSSSCYHHLNQPSL